jgi:predicted methyltransferase
MATNEIDLKEAVNAVSDVVQNRPRPLRELDQIYMKTGDMLMQAELVARWADGKRLAFIGDGDAISTCVAYLHHRKIINYGPSKIVVFDFDERICNATARFADHERLDQLEAKLYNCLEPFPHESSFDLFYTNPPWGASNEGESVKVFAQRGMEATGYGGEGLVVIADDDELEWCKRVLHRTQQFAGESGFFVQKMMSKMHRYHLDDAPDLRSCNLFLRAVGAARIEKGASRAIVDEARLANFYGRDNPPRVRYVRERQRVDYGKAHDDEYRFETFNKEA